MDFGNVYIWYLERGTGKIYLKMIYELTRNEINEIIYMPEIAINIKNQIAIYTKGKK
jgi:hypothetical protein